MSSHVFRFLRHASRLGTLLASVAILLIGHGLQLTLLPLRAGEMGWSQGQIGLSGSCYFAGLLLGCFTIPGLVRKVGHVRVFTVLTALMTSAVLSIALVNAVAVWFAMRFAIGWAIAGLYLVIESWLNEQVDNADRGSLVSLYTTTVLLAMAAGQLLLNLGAPSSFELVIVAALFLALAAVPIGLTRIPQPDPVPSATFSPLLVLRTSRAAAVSSFISGLVSGCFYAVGPALGQLLNLELKTISIMMAAGILGGAVFLLPLGRMSDRVDRRIVIFAVMLAGSAVCGLGMVTPVAFLPWLFFLFGGCVMPIYALSLAHAGDIVESSFLEVGTGILIMNAVGAIIGPLLGAVTMGYFGPWGFFAFCGITMAAGAIAVMCFIGTQRSRRPNFSPFEMATTASAQGAVELDPRSDDDAEVHSS